MPTVNPAPISPKPQLELSSGLPAVGGQLFFYVAGSVNTKQNTYTDSTGSVANTNPILLNALGMPTTEIWFTAGLSYKVVYAPAGDTDPPTSPIWAIDDLRGINDTTIAMDQWVDPGLTPTFVNVTSFTLPGDQTTDFHVGRRTKTTNSGGTVYSTIAASVFGALTTVTVVNDSGTLDSGLSAVSIGLLTAVNPSVPQLLIAGSGISIAWSNGKPTITGSGASIGDMAARLTLTTAVPVTTADVTAAETIYYTPFRGNRIWLYNGTIWVAYALAEISADVPDAIQMNDVFVYDNAGTLTLDFVAWTNDTTRATALTTQDGILVKTGALGRRYVGSFYSTTAGNGQTEDSLANRFLWNYYNRVSRPMRNAPETTDNWTYTTATFRQANANTANQLNFVTGVSEDEVSAQVLTVSGNSASANRVGGIGVDSTSVNSAQTYTSTSQITGPTEMTLALYSGYPGVGKHFISWLEVSLASGTSTWFGDVVSAIAAQTGIHGRLWA